MRLFALIPRSDDTHTVCEALLASNGAADARSGITILLLNSTLLFLYSAASTFLGSMVPIYLPSERDLIDRTQGIVPIGTENLSRCFFRD